MIITSVIPALQPTYTNLFEIAFKPFAESVLYTINRQTRFNYRACG